MRRIISLIFILLVAGYLSCVIYTYKFSKSTNIPQQADAIVVLGSRVYLDNSPSQTLLHRAVEAARLYKMGKAKYVITTGGVGLGKLAEADAAAKVLVDQGVPKAKILSERDSHNTYENFSNLTSLAQKYNIRSIIIVSDQSHLARAAMVARGFGFKPIYWDYPNFKDYTSQQEIIFDYAREGAAIMVYWPRLYINGLTKNFTGKLTGNFTGPILSLQMPGAHVQNH